jgi:hypothetical protein
MKHVRKAEGFPHCAAAEPQDHADKHARLFFLRHILALTSIGELLSRLL